ncbi:PorP/SprF family type IX secretion system membrane protein [Flavobacterium sediminis]|uniref:PorP/SprF family type IX secretion system membrane protein n=1 Tax=Flavobacterium sediminis TaxID=2201181 RepID=UPI0015D0CF25|nr:type IX secretion system membrane protein PorP/SprF [Flavobacterium sediminis]
MKKKLQLLILLFSTTILFAQQDPQYTNYMFNPMLFNPAYAGSRGVFSVFGLHRSQWAGLDGAPITNCVSVNSPVGLKGVGMGLIINNDKLGPSVENNISANFSYSIYFSNLSTLSFGLKASLDVLNVDYSKLSFYDPSDPRYQYNINNQVSPNFGAGLYWYSYNYYLGFSIPNFLETKHYNDEIVSTKTDHLHYYFVGGYIFTVTSTIEYKPAFLTKVIQGGKVQVDLTSNFRFYEKFEIGASYRISGAVSGVASFQLTPGLLIGYSYDAETSRLANYNSGTHEFFLRLELPEKGKIIESPRFF